MNAGFVSLDRTNASSAKIADKPTTIVATIRRTNAVPKRDGRKDRFVWVLTQAPPKPVSSANGFFSPLSEEGVLSIDMLTKKY